MEKNIFRGKCKLTGGFVKGYFYKGYSGSSYIMEIQPDLKTLIDHEVIPLTVGLCSGSKDKNGVDIYQGDKITSFNGKVLEVRFGEYQSYCPADHCCMKSVGFYAHLALCPDMPLGPTEDYAVVVDNIYG